MIDVRFWAGRRVLLTGHTGFKGAWTCLVLRHFGADVSGYALEPQTPNDLFNVAEVQGEIRHHIGDIRDRACLEAAFQEACPQIVIHMAAQALVRPSYEQPVETYATNVMGTVHVLDVVRRAPPRMVEAVVVVTSDKCYENNGWVWGYRETDHLGGHDPYSNSKGCAELVTNAYRQSFFRPPSLAGIASGRAGNVVGGGDWSKDRLVPDAIRAFMANEPLRIRSPLAVRPWQHVLDPVLGYLVLAERLVRNSRRFAEAWNFGPVSASEVPVEHIVDRLVALWGDGASWERDSGDHPHEAAYLKLDCSKALAGLGWRPVLDLDQALRLTVEWYRAWAGRKDMRAFTEAQIAEVLHHGAAVVGAGCRPASG